MSVFPGQALTQAGVGQSGNRHRSGMSSEQALVRNMRTCRSDVKGEAKAENPRGESTKAEHRGGPSCSSVELPVMGRERRRWLVRFEADRQPVMGGAV